MPFRYGGNCFSRSLRSCRCKSCNFSNMLRREENRVAHFPGFEFPAGKREKWPIFRREKTGKTGKNPLVKAIFFSFQTFISFFQFDPDQANAIRKQFIVLQKIIVTFYLAKLVKFWYFWQFLANLSQNREISRENSHSPPGNFPVAISRFPFSHREMCISIGEWSFKTLAILEGKKELN